MKTPRSIRLLAAAVLLGPAAGVAAQSAPADPTLVDRVVAVVGDSVVLWSQIQEEIQRLQLQGRPMPTDPAGQQRLLQEVLDTWVNRVLVLQAAARDTLVQVDEDRVQEIVNQEIQRRTQRFGGQQALQQALRGEGLTLAQYREILTNQVRQEQTQQMFMQLRLRDAPPVVITEEELRQAFEEASGQLQERPRLISFEQVVVAPQPSDSAVEAARARAQAILDSIRAGADFEEMARRYSQDPGSAPNGGDLDWFRRGTMVREFEDVAFALQDGQVSDLVKTEFGFHIIRIDRSRAGERKGRHILIMPERSEADLERAREVARSVAAQAGAGISMETLYERYSDPAAPDTLTVTADQLKDLPPGYDRLADASEGDVVGPIEYEAARGEKRLAVVRVRSIREAGAYTFEDVKDQLQAQLTQRRQLEHVLADLRKKTYIEIRM